MAFPWLKSRNGAGSGEEKTKRDQLINKHCTFAELSSYKYYTSQKESSGYNHLSYILTLTFQAYHREPIRYKCNGSFTFNAEN